MAGGEGRVRGKGRGRGEGRGRGKGRARAGDVQSGKQVLLRPAYRGGG